MAESANDAATDASEATPGADGEYEGGPHHDYEREEWSELNLCEMQLRAISPTLSWYRDTLTGLFLAQNHLAGVPSVVFTLTRLRRLDLSCNLLSELPSEIGKLRELRELDVFSNYLTALPLQMGRLHKIKQLGLDNNQLRMPPPQIIEQGAKQVIVYLRDRMPAPKPLPERHWIVPPAYNDSDTISFTAMNWNVLAKSYATASLYSYTPSWALRWSYRKEKILAEILSYDPDVMCLQEVEGGHYQDFFQPSLQKHGYDSTYEQKTRVRSAADPSVVDGCAIFFKQSRMKLVSSHLIEYNTLAIQQAEELKQDEDGFSKLMSKDNIAVAAFFEMLNEPSEGTSSPVGSNKYLLVLNTHIHWDPRFADVKVMQVQLLTEEVEKVLQRISKERGVAVKDIPLLLCGDFNSLPGSGVYTFLQSGRLDKNHQDFGENTYGHYAQKGLRHDFKFVSTYRSVMNEEPAFTNYTGSFQGTLDYIWYDKERLRPAGVLEPVPEAAMADVTGFPDAHMPSDHIPLVARFDILNTVAARRRSSAVSDNAAAGSRFIRHMDPSSSGADGPAASTIRLPLQRRAAMSPPLPAAAAAAAAAAEPRWASARPATGGVPGRGGFVPHQAARGSPQTAHRAYSGAVAGAGGRVSQGAPSHLALPQHANSATPYMQQQQHQQHALHLSQQQHQLLHGVYSASGYNRSQAAAPSDASWRYGGGGGGGSTW